MKILDFASLTQTLRSAQNGKGKINNSYTLFQESHQSGAEIAIRPVRQDGCDIALDFLSQPTGHPDIGARTDAGQLRKVKCSLRAILEKYIT